MPYEPQNRFASLASGEEYDETEAEVCMPFNLASNSQNPPIKEAVFNCQSHDMALGFSS
jgi:hypothetical protein